MAERYNLVQAFQKSVTSFPDKPFYKFKKAGEWREITFASFAEKVYAAASALAEKGVKAGDKVALISENRLEWAIVDYALLHLEAVNVPIYPSLLENQIEFIVKNSEAETVIVSNSLQAEKIQSIRPMLSQVRNYIIFEEAAEGFLDFWQMVNQAAGENPDYSAKAASIDPDMVMTLIYTSGTTGFPKGVMLTHWNFASNVAAGLEVLHVDENDRFLSFLPLSHVFERMAGHYLAMSIGATIAYAEGIDYVAQNMQEIHPTVMTAVPRLYEKMHARVVETAETGSPLKRKIFFWAITQGKRAFELKKRGVAAGWLQQRKLALANKLVFSKLQARLGGQMRFFVSGGAPLSREVGEFFAYADILILEGYGLTETSPVIAVNRLESYKFGSVGPILPGVEVNIAEDGEILTRGPHIMVGYYKNEEATKEVIDSDGWFHTGDIGYLDEEGFLVITDRKKNLIVTSGGKNIAPQPIENMLIASKYIDQVVIIGDRKRFCSALIVPNPDALRAWAGNENLNDLDISDLVKHEAVAKLIRREIDRLSTELASYETIKKFALLPDPFTIESGELTPTLKVKRKMVEENYKDLIADFYAE
jgi:long-chain acyl-CoA synthetase